MNREKRLDCPKLDSGEEQFLSSWLEGDEPPISVKHYTIKIDPDAPMPTWLDCRGSHRYFPAEAAAPSRSK